MTVPYQIRVEKSGDVLIAPHDVPEIVCERGKEPNIRSAFPSSCETFLRQPLTPNLPCDSVGPDSVLAPTEVVSASADFRSVRGSRRECQWFQKSGFRRQLSPPTIESRTCKPRADFQNLTVLLLIGSQSLTNLACAALLEHLHRIDCDWTMVSLFLHRTTRTRWFVTLVGVAEVPA